MGASNGKRLQCPLCHEECRNQVTLRCEHSFCQGCIGELWSGSTGPYYCPECKYEYKELPNHGDGASTSAESNWTLGKKLSSRYSSKISVLGKRKSSSAFPGKNSGGYRLGSGPPKATAVITVTDSDDEAPVRKKRPTADGCPSESQPPSVVWRKSSTSGETSTQGTPPETTSSADEMASPRTEVSQERNTSSVRDDQRVVTPRQNTPKKEKVLPNTRGTSSIANDLPRATVTSHSAGTRAQVSPSNSDEHLASSHSDTSREGLSHGSTVPCHYCHSSEQKVAVKTCLVCGASMCTEHLRAHLEKTVFQSHTLVDAVEDVSLWRCQEHQEMNRIYCRTCGVCVCTVCSLVGSHKGHECISIREAEQEFRGSLKDEMKKICDTKKSILEKVSELSATKNHVQSGLEEVRAAVLHQYRAIREALEQEEQQALHCVAQEENRVLGCIKKQLDSLQGALESSQTILNTLQGMTNTQGASQYQNQAFIMEYSKIAAELSGLSDPVQKLDPPEQVNQDRLDCLQDWTEGRLDSVLISLPHRDPFRLLYGISPTLDLNTAHPKLILSDEGRTVQYSETQQDYPDQDTRFNIFPQVLGSSALERGSSYWEVEVPLDEGRWKVGVCDGQISRKGQKDTCRIGFYPNSWCLVFEKGKVEALHDKAASPVCATGLWKVGVLLDFDAGRLSFYSVTKEGALSLLYSFEHAFTDPLYPALAVSKTQLRICNIFTRPTTD